MFYVWVYGPTQFACCRSRERAVAVEFAFRGGFKRFQDGRRGFFLLCFSLVSVSSGQGSGPLAVRGGDCGWGTLAGCWLKPGSQAGSHCKLERACRLLQQHSALLALWLGERGLPLRAH